MSTSNTSRSPWEVYDYELDMLQKLLKEPSTHPRLIQNAISESTLLHLRILTDLLLSRGREDDIKLQGLLQQFAPEHPLVKEPSNNVWPRRRGHSMVEVEQTASPRNHSQT